MSKRHVAYIYCYTYDIRASLPRLIRCKLSRLRYHVTALSCPLTYAG